MVRWTFRFGRLNRLNRPRSGSKACLERLRPLGQVDEEEPLPAGDGDAVERPVGLVEALDIAGGGRADQAAVQGVGPGVVGALDGLGEPAGVLLAEPGAPVAADVVVRPVAARPVAQHDDALLPDLLEEVVARIGDPLLPADADPAPQEDALHLLRQDLRRGEILARQGVGPVDGNLGRLDEGGHGSDPVSRRWTNMPSARIPAEGIGGVIWLTPRR